MKRTSYSIYRCNSALYGVSVELKDRLHANLLAFADTEPGLRDYCVYAPSFVYNNRAGEKEDCYVISAKFDDGHLEVWSSTWERPPVEESPLECSRQTHARSLGAEYRLFTAKEFSTSFIELKNRQIMQAFLFMGRRTDTTTLEKKLLDLLQTEKSLSLNLLATHLNSPLPLVQLALFRQWRNTQIRMDICSALIAPSLTISGGSHA